MTFITFPVPIVPIIPPFPDEEPTNYMSTIPDWLLTHPELRKRGLSVHTPLQPVSRTLAAYTYDSLNSSITDIVHSICD